MTQIATTSGERIEIPAAGVTAIVGPNNSGKSSFLRQITTHLRHGMHVPPWEKTFLIEKVTTATSGGEWESLHSWLQLHANITRNPSNGQLYVRRPGAGEVPLATLNNSGNENFEGGLQSLNDFIVFYGDAWQRINGVNPVEMRENFDDPPGNPLHALQDSPKLFRELSEISERVFGEPLTMDRLSRFINLRVGTIDAEAPKIDEIAEDYQKALSRLPLLTEQGDGMKSLIGLLVPLITSTYPVVIIDEPEAFLHPPQAAILGRILGEQARSRNLQIIIATHDRHLLSGLLESQSNLSIVRIERQRNDQTRFSQLEVEDVKEIWSDPVLRYSNVLDGLFHKLVVLAEADRDCRFFASALEEYEPKDSLTILSGDVLFVPSGGKDSLRRLAKVLRSIHVSTVVSPDLDILNSRESLRALIDSLGGNWESLAGDYKTATSPFSQPRTGVLISQVVKAVAAQFEGRGGEPFTSVERNEIMAQIRLKDNPWSAVKSYGMVAFKGEAAVAANRLLENLKTIGITPVRVGELECFAPGLGVSKGPAWLPAAIAGGYHSQPAARDHITEIMSAYEKVTTAYES
ncbi:ATP-dependent nuclease [Streptomyces microflavus]|uniref:ATP-dependent nuclease n=1 Tax=Streptomyces microflavus TaxID=1919 RepID=UPI00362F81B4